MTKKRTEPVPVQERVAAFRKRRTAAGFVQINNWVHADDVQRVREYVARLTRARQRA